MFICVAINSLVTDKAFSIPSSPAMLTLNTAKALVKWIPTNLHEVELFQTQLTNILSSCVQLVPYSSTATVAELGGGWRGLGPPCDFSLYSDVSAWPPPPQYVYAHVHVFSSLCASSPLIALSNASLLS